MVMLAYSHKSMQPNTKKLPNLLNMMLSIEENSMLMTDTPVIQVSTQLDYTSSNDELNRLLCAAVVSKSFRSILVANPESAAKTGYQGESFNMSEEDRCWLSSIRPTSLVDFAANLANYQQNNRQESRVKLPVEPVPQYVRVN
jgi:hypothetical protein